MKINLDRLCKLAGVSDKEKTFLNEASNRSHHEDQTVSDEADFRFGKGQLSEGEDMEEVMSEEDSEDSMNEASEDEDMDEMVEVDEAILVQEIRRAKKIMAESRVKKQQEKEKIQETHLRKIIAKEVDAAFKDLNLTSGWIYGNKTPKNRHKGAVNTAFPGIGFKK
jgi:hypothetical protein